MNRRTVAGVVVLLLLLGGLIWYATKHKKSEEQAVTPLLSVSAFNQTQNKDATIVPARPQDLVSFTLTAENQTGKTVPGYVIEANISQVTDKSTLIDASGASYNSATNSLVWTPLDIPAQQSIEKKFSVRVNPNSANSVMVLKFNNEVQVTVASSTVAGATQTPANSPGTNGKPYKAPVTGNSTTATIILSLIATFLFWRVQQWKTRRSES